MGGARIGDFGMQNFDGWRTVRELGSGGQGTVYLVQDPSQAADLEEAAKSLRPSIEDMLSVDPEHRRSATARLASAIRTLGRQDEDLGIDLGALKRFRILDGQGLETEQAIRRFERELEALRRAVAALSNGEPLDLDCSAKARSMTYSRDSTKQEVVA
jgi:serine/threonine protein kinase